MTYLQDKKNKNKKIRNYIIFSVFVFMFVFGAKGIFSFLKPFTATLQSKIYLGKDYFSDTASGALETKKSLRRKVLELENRLALYESKEAEVSMQGAQLQELRDILGINETAQETFTVRKVSGTSLYGTFNVTSNTKNINIGDIVLSKNGYYVGNIVDENKNGVATVQIAEKSKQEIDLFLAQSEIKITAKGHSRNVLVAQIPKDVQVELGETVVLGDALSIPVGSIVSQSEDERSPLKEIYIRAQAQAAVSDFYIIKSK